MVHQTKPLWQTLETGPEGKVPDVIYVIVEIPMGGSGKYEVDGAIFLDRELFTSMVYPGDYGCIPRTLCLDGDPADALVLVSHPHYPGVVIPIRPIAKIEMEDEEGIDHKILGVPDTKVDPNFAHMKDLEDVSKQLREKIEHFFKHMKELEPGKWVKIGRWRGARAAKKYILESVARYKEKFGE